MKIEIDLDSHVFSLIEYIPRDELPGVLSNLIKEVIESKSSIRVNEAVQSSNSMEVRKIMDFMESLASNTVPVNTDSKDSKSVKKDKPKIQAVTSADIDLSELDLGDLGDLAALIK